MTGLRHYAQLQGQLRLYTSYFLLRFNYCPQAGETAGRRGSDHLPKALMSIKLKNQRLPDTNSFPIAPPGSEKLAKGWDVQGHGLWEVEYTQGWDLYKG